eukprot:CAMPEP_0174350604 /NCGR_PEP_ID=MMETSP0811_2-20130205/7712_1 /TAXON_ID=73025 ORGANISM="Eutreptiella gymnastica-like, Strain CCMP1594" /NCGR_SAMPLE_ID=MMETSP0811_2 /ASSEMBLY_ACC=CAM_ASM_000667 /LENGTH=48 /DNA_ID= /DNA_START= /DNA_END= /DNA_ORIENTATION=
MLQAHGGLNIKFSEPKRWYVMRQQQLTSDSAKAPSEPQVHLSLRVLSN